MPHHTDTLRAALETDTPFESALEFAKRLRDQGMRQEELTHLYSKELLLHRESPDERKWNALTDTLDFIVGWCPQGNALYPVSGQGSPP